MKDWRWPAVALLVGVVGVMGAAAMGAAPATRPLVIAPENVAPELRVVQLLGEDPVGEWKGVPLYVQVSGRDAATLGQAKWEVRKAGTQEPVLSVDLHLPPSFAGGGGGRSARGPSVADARPRGLRTAIMGEAANALDQLPDGDYLAAFVIDGHRVSNVVQVTRAAKHQISDEPLVRMVVAEAPAAGEPPAMGIVATRRAQADPELGPMELMGADVSVDGQSYPSHGGGYSGPGAPKVGGRMLMPVDGQQRGITWDAGTEHTVKAVVAGNASAEVKVPAGAPLAEAWDAATEKAADKEGAR